MISQWNLTTFFHATSSHNSRSTWVAMSNCNVYIRQIFLKIFPKSISWLQKLIPKYVKKGKCDHNKQFFRISCDWQQKKLKSLFFCYIYWGIWNWYNHYLNDHAEDLTSSRSVFLNKLIATHFWVTKTKFDLLCGLSKLNLIQIYQILNVDKQ